MKAKSATRKLFWHYKRLGFMKMVVGSGWALITMCLGPVFGLRLAVIDARNIGHLALYPDIAYHEYISKYTFSNWRRVRWEILGPVSNEYLLSLWVNKFQIRNSYFGISTACGILRKVHLNKLTMSVSQYSGDINDVTSKTNPPINPSSRDLESIKFLLEQQFSIANTNNIVCLHIRDETYDVKIKKQESGIKTKNLRNTTFEPFVASIEYLCSLGYTVILMGTHSHKTDKVKNHRFIDLQQVVGSNPKLDIILVYLCTFFWAGSVSGFYEVASLFRKPILFCNYFPLYSLPTYQKKSLVMPKFLFESNKSQVISLTKLFAILEEATVEHSNNPYFDHLKFQLLDPTRNWTVEENSEVEILAALEEFICLLNGNRFEDQPRSEWEEIFLRQMPSPFVLAPKRIRIASRFLSSYEEELSLLRRP